MEKQEKNKLRFMLVLPVLVLPLLALGFYALGGGKGDEAGKAVVSAGINVELPGAQLKGRQQADKLALYEQAVRDSARVRHGLAGNAFAAFGLDSMGHTRLPSAEVNEEKITQRLAEINRQVNAPVGHAMNNGVGGREVSSPASLEIDRLERLVRQKSQGDTVDPEMKQLNGMLDKIMQIQNPGLAKAKQTDKPASKDSAFKAITATIDGNQKVMNGGVVKLRLQDTVKLNGIIIPKGQSIAGSCTITNQRLFLDIKNIRVGTCIVPVSLTVFSLDGMQGINAPEAELSEAAGNGANGALENMEFLSMEQSLSTQAATAGINAAKGLLGKKVRKIRVKLRGGVTVLLRMNK